MRVGAYPEPPVSPEAEYQRRAELLEASMFERNVAAAGQIDFAVFGLDDSWIGIRSVGGFGGAPRVDRLTLVHGEPSDIEAPLLRVETHRPSHQLTAAGGADRRHLMAARGLARELMAAVGVRDDRLTSSLRSKDPTVEWDRCNIDVAGRSHELRSLEMHHRWIALGWVDAQIVAIESRSVPVDDVHLVAIDDLSPYLDNR